MHLFREVLEKVLARVLGLHTLLNSIDLFLNRFVNFALSSSLDKKKKKIANTHHIHVLPGARKHSERNVDPVNIIGSRETIFYPQTN